MNDGYIQSPMVGIRSMLISDELQQSFAAAARYDLVKGFAVGRTIFGNAARAWLAGTITDQEAVDEMAGKYRDLCEVWDRVRAQKGEAA